MTVKIDKNMDEGAGRGESKESGASSYQQIMLALHHDNQELRAQFIALLAKLDDDAGVTDTNYESTLTPADLEVTE